MLPFWKPETSGEQIEGLAGKVRQITGKFGQSDIINVGEYAVNITAGLSELAGLEGKYVRLTYMGDALNERTGNHYKDFKIEVADS
jgi:hypothetical protein